MRWQEIVEAQEIAEAFSGAVPVQWTYRSEQMWNGSFTIDQQKYGIDLTLEDGYDEEGAAWDLEFSALGHGVKFRNSGAMGQRSIVVFGSVVQGLLEFLETTGPQRVKFLGSKEQGRDGLYEKIMRNMAGKLSGLGYQWSSKNVGNSVLFFINKGQ
jgi:hypothetical protein